MTHRPQYGTSAIGGLLAERGHTVIISSSPHHHDLNTIEQIWGAMENRAAANNLMFTLGDVQHLACLLL
jgi:hypothetical protein